mmetsp:Transcript_21305/g.35890  ORF Transcript_21305/g.35890 Transcript_21305/m.35890 type:complete len:320 (-) Transcript_21305:685-1644(-)
MSTLVKRVRAWCFDMFLLFSPDRNSTHSFTSSVPLMSTSTRWKVSRKFLTSAMVYEGSRSLTVGMGASFSSSSSSPLCAKKCLMVVPSRRSMDTMVWRFSAGRCLALRLRLLILSDLSWRCLVATSFSHCVTAPSSASMIFPMYCEILMRSRVFLGDGVAVEVEDSSELRDRDDDSWPITAARRCPWRLASSTCSTGGGLGVSGSCTGSVGSVMECTAGLMNSTSLPTPPAAFLIRACARAWRAFCLARSDILVRSEITVLACLYMCCCLPKLSSALFISEEGYSMLVHIPTFFNMSCDWERRYTSSLSVSFCSFRRMA